MSVGKPLNWQHLVFISVVFSLLLCQCQALGRAGSARGGSTSRGGSYRSSVRFSSGGTRLSSGSYSSGSSSNLKTVLGIVFGCISGLILVIFCCCCCLRNTGHRSGGPTLVNVGPPNNSQISTIYNYSNEAAVSPSIDAIDMHTYGISSNHLDAGTAGPNSYDSKTAYNPPPSYDSVVKSATTGSDLPYSPKTSD